MKCRYAVEWAFNNRGGAMFSSMAGLLGVWSSIRLSYLIQKEKHGQKERK